MFDALLIEAIFGGWFMAGGVSRHGLGELGSTITSAALL